MLWMDRLQRARRSLQQSAWYVHCRLLLTGGARRATEGAFNATSSGTRGAIHDLVRCHGQSVSQCLDTVSRQSRDRQNLSALEHRPGGRAVDLCSHIDEPFGRNNVSLGQCNQCARDTEQIDDGKMFDRLRHDFVIGGDGQQREIDWGAKCQRDALREAGPVQRYRPLSRPDRLISARRSPADSRHQTNRLRIWLVSFKSMVWDTSISEQKTLQPSTTRSARGCYPPGISANARGSAPAFLR